MKQVMIGLQRLPKLVLKNSAGLHLDQCGLSQQHYLWSSSVSVVYSNASELLPDLYLKGNKHSLYYFKHLVHNMSWFWASNAPIWGRLARCTLLKGFHNCIWFVDEIVGLGINNILVKYESELSNFSFCITRQLCSFVTFRTITELFMKLNGGDGQCTR